MVEVIHKNKLKKFLEKWIKNKINNELESLIRLKQLKENKSEIRALAYNLYENNGVVKEKKCDQLLIN